MYRFAGLRLPQHFLSFSRLARHRASYAPAAACCQVSPAFFRSMAPTAMSSGLFQVAHVPPGQTDSILTWRSLLSSQVPPTATGACRQRPNVPWAALSPDAPESQRPPGRCCAWATWTVVAFDGVLVGSS